MDKKKLGIILGIVAVVVIVVVVLCVRSCGKSKTNEKELTKNLEKLGSQFYEEFYYPSQEKSQEDVKAFVEKFKSTGIKVDLENMSKTSKVDKKLVEAMVNSKTKEKCDTKGSYVTIFPKKPFGKEDYTIEVTLSCGFDKKEDKKSK